VHACVPCACERLYAAHTLGDELVHASYTCVRRKDERERERERGRMYVYACVCVRACVRERESEKEAGV